MCELLEPRRTSIPIDPRKHASSKTPHCKAQLLRKAHSARLIIDLNRGMAGLGVLSSARAAA